MKDKKKRNKNIRMSEYSNEELLNMDIIEVYKLLLEGRITRFPPGVWERPEAIENSIKCAKYLIEEILNWNLEDVKSKIRMSIFNKYKLSGMMQKLYRNSPYEVLSLAYPNQFMPWELHEAPTKIWHEKENRIKAMDWLINTKLKWSREDIINNYNGQVLIDNNLGGLLSEGGQGSPFKLLDEFMEGKFKPWEFKQGMSSVRYWEKKENRVYAIKNLIENVLGWNEEQVKKYLNQETFNNNDLGGLIASKYYNGSPYKALTEAYPDKKYLPWEMSSTPTGFWDDKQNRINAVKWLFETQLNWSIEDIKTNISQKVFIDNGLISLLGKQKGGLYTIVSEAYPEIHEWELPMVNSSFWESKENRIEAMDWLFKTKLNWSIEDIKSNISQNTFRIYGLSGLLKYHNGSPYNVVAEYLPDENIKAWELPVTPNGFWKKDENCIDAIYWMIDKFDINLNNLETLTKSFLMKQKIYGVVFNKYNDSMVEFKKDLINILNNNK